MKFIKLNHTKYDENGVPVYTIKELAEESVSYVVVRKTGKQPDLHNYGCSLRQRLQDSIPPNVHRHKNERLVRNEARVTIEAWLNAHKAYLDPSASYRVNLDGMKQKLESMHDKSDGSGFTHYPSKNYQKSAKLGQPCGPYEMKTYPEVDYPEDVPSVTVMKPNPSGTTYTTAEFTFMDYHKTDQLKVLCTEVLKVINNGKSKGNLDDDLANRCFSDLMLGLWALGGAK